MTGPARDPADQRPWPRRRAGVALAVAVLAVGAAAVGRAALGRPRATTAPPHVPAATAAVTRATVTEQIQLAGVLGFDGERLVAHHAAAGILTSVARPGTVVGRGRVLYAVANTPVRLLFGTVPAYRDFAAGMPDGPDVEQLERNLGALRLDPGPVDRRFTTATASAIRRWQARIGLPYGQRTGTLPLGAVMFAPAALRVGRLRATVGDRVGTDEPVLSATSTRRVATAPLSADRQSLVHAGDKVRVAVSGIETPVAGTVLRVGQGSAAAAPTDASDTGGPPGDGPAEGGLTGDGLAGAGADPAADDGPRAARVTLIVRVRLPARAPDLDQVPARVSITTATRTNVLVVPVVALLPRAGGGYQVRLAGGGHVPVRPGLFDSDNGTVEVAGRLTVGQLVQVPAP